MDHDAGLAVLHPIRDLDGSCQHAVQVMEPIGVVDVGEPFGVVDDGEAHVLDFAEGLPHHVDVVDVQKVELGIRIDVLVFVSEPNRIKI